MDYTRINITGYSNQTMPRTDSGIQYYKDVEVSDIKLGTRVNLPNISRADLNQNFVD